MRKSSIIGLSMLTAGLLASSAASAGIVTVDGVSIPEGFVPGGFYIDAELSFENVVTKVGQTFNGIFKVDAIHDASANGTYAYGQNGSYLTGIFENFVATSVVAPTSSTGGTITFTGGDIMYYVESSNTFTNNAGQATDIANASSGKLWLAADPAAIDSSGHTLIITIPANNSLTAFSNAGANALLDVRSGAAGGDAGAYFDTNTFADSSRPAQNADILFQGGANSGASGDFPISGTNFIKANVLGVPEPISISLFGAGLAGIAAFGARRRKNKQA